MKKGYIRLIVFDILLLLIIFLNSFFWNILTTYGILFFLILVIILFNVFFGIEKDRHRYLSDVIVDIIISLCIYFLLYYFFGLVIGFAKTGNYYNFKGLFNFIIPITLLIVLKEYLRYQIMVKTQGNKILPVLTCILFIFLDITNAIYYGSFTSSYQSFIFLALTLLPAITTNIVCTYLTLKVGYKPIIIYLLITTLYQYLIPIIPNPDEYLTSIINLILPVVIGYRINIFFKNESDEDVDIDFKHKRRTTILSLSFSTIIVGILVYFVSGYFRFQAIAVASGSMSPLIYRGDVVIVDKINGDYDSLEVGQIVAVKYENIIVVHRLIDIKKDNGIYYFYTKGDANSQADDYVIQQEMVIGKVVAKVPYVGLPTVWLNEF
jgi:signal peptidase